MVLPAGSPRTIAGIETFDGEVDEAFPPMSVTVRLADEIDVSRGDMICRVNNQPTVKPGHRRDGLLDDERASLRPAQKLAIKHTTRWPGRSSRTSSTGSTSTRCTATRRPRSSPSTRSGGCSLRTTAPLLCRPIFTKPHHRVIHLSSS
jgi:bifunctional enzyme CysN/CysC